MYDVERMLNIVRKVTKYHCGKAAAASELTVCFKMLKN